MKNQFPNSIITVLRRLDYLRCFAVLGRLPRLCSAAFLLIIIQHVPRGGESSALTARLAILDALLTRGLPVYVKLVGSSIFFLIWFIIDAIVVIILEASLAAFFQSIVHPQAWVGFHVVGLTSTSLALLRFVHPIFGRGRTGREEGGS